MGRKTGPVWSKIIQASNIIHNKPDEYSLDTILNMFDEIDTSDESFRQFLLKKEFKDNDIPKMILKRIYCTGELIIDPDIQLEHILPKSSRNISKNWKQFTKEEHKHYINHIGNLTLLTSEDNRGCSDDSFEEKKENVYSKSKLTENINISKLSDWTKETIEARDARLITMIIEKW